MRLDEISYKFADGFLSALKFSFSNGIVSKDLQTEEELKKNKQWKHIEIDVNDIITQIEADLDS